MWRWDGNANGLVSLEAGGVDLVVFLGGAFYARGVVDRGRWPESGEEGERGVGRGGREEVGEGK